LTINTLVSNYKDSAMRLDLVKILGVNKSVTNVTVNGKSYSNYLYNIPDQVYKKNFVFHIKSYFSY